jgi:signal transduction histidine kinase
MMKSRSTIRLRLTLFYGVSFVLCGIALLFINHRFVNEGLLKDEGHSDQRVIDTYQYTPEQVSFFYNIPTPASPTHPEAHNIRDVIRGIQGDIRTEVLDNSLQGSLVALAVMFILSIGVGWIAAGRALRPVEKLTARARSLSENNLHERLALDGPSDELKELGDTLDAMLGRLQSAFESQRRVSASVSHELRTPLSVIRGEAELLLAEKDVSDRERRFAESVRTASDRSEALLSSLLALARSESTM